MAVIDSMAELSAWAHLRSGGGQKSVIADDLIAFGNRHDWQLPLIDLAQCEAQVAPAGKRIARLMIAVR